MLVWEHFKEVRYAKSYYAAIKKARQKNY